MQRKVALITGIKRIGRSVAEALLREGWCVSVVYNTSEDVYKELKEGYGDRVLGIKTDLTQDNHQRIVEETYGHFGRLDAFLHLASPYFPTPLEELNPSHLYLHFKPIAEAFIFIAKHAFFHMLKNEGTVKGRIIAYGDWATNLTPYRNYVAYFVAKGALHTAVKVLAREMAPHVLVNAIALGPVLIPDHVSEEKWRDYLQKTPLKRPVSVEDIVLLSLTLLRMDSMTGEILYLDSGRNISGSCG